MMELISINDLRISPIYAKPISATNLKKYIVSNTFEKISFTSTTPHIYVQTTNNLFFISYRLFIVFASSLKQVEEPTIDWIKCGF